MILKIFNNISLAINNHIVNVTVYNTKITITIMTQIKLYEQVEEAFTRENQ